MGRGRDDRERPLPIEVIVEVGERGAPRDAGAEPTGPDRRVLVAVLVGIVVVAGLAWAFGDDGAPASADDPVPTTAAPGPVPSAPPVGMAGGFSVATAIGDDGLVEVTARTHDPGAPWVTFEVCASAPPGCAPVWTTELDQDGSTFTAVLRVPDRFVAPGGFDHDCVPDGCELRVATTTGSVVFAIDQGRPLLREAAAEAASIATTTLAPRPPGMGVVVEPVDGGVRVLVEGAPPGRSVTVGACPVVALRCPVLAQHFHRALDERRGDPIDVTVAVPSVMSGWVVAADGSASWADTDCEAADCVVEVGIWGEAVARVPLPAGLLPPADPTLAVASGPVAPGAFVRVVGAGFDANGEGPTGRASWLLCDTRPPSFDAISSRCGTPRIVRQPVIGADGGLDILVPAPDPATVRTWVGNRPLECREECWLVVLAEPFPRLAAAPIAYAAP